MSYNHNGVKSAKMRGRSVKINDKQLVVVDDLWLCLRQYTVSELCKFSDH
ncbi:hypothetical protein EGR_10338 [Echinococcus granulosus]|uniref:Uncharacterized protein n=1 Tax=Echinococcus granulosus TaxID=6210 RepID=W6UMU2_ECHGR|nr:hypothetical protein EGR_10338 [Echinococcus granulosus]EUB54809.1 hypothetical protein EGR_10338 [Echinococcus granulosus]